MQSKANRKRGGFFGSPLSLLQASKGPSNTADGLLSQAGLGAPLVLAWQKRDRLGKETLDT
ncbi:hypothetical protein E2320_012444, partial [Naja naja]